RVDSSLSLLSLHDALPIFLHVAIELVVEFVRAERGFIMLVDEGTNRVWGKATRNIDPQALERVLSGKDANNQPEISRTIIQETIDRKSTRLNSSHQIISYA